MMSLVLAEQSLNLHLYLVRVIPIEQEVHRTYTKWLPLRVVQLEILGCKENGAVMLHAIDN